MGAEAPGLLLLLILEVCDMAGCAVVRQRGHQLGHCRSAGGRVGGGSSRASGAATSTSAATSAATSSSDGHANRGSADADSDADVAHSAPLLLLELLDVVVAQGFVLGLDCGLVQQGLLVLLRLDQGVEVVVLVVRVHVVRVFELRRSVAVLAQACNGCFVDGLCFGLGFDLLGHAILLGLIRLG